MASVSSALLWAAQAPDVVAAPVHGPAALRPRSSRWGRTLTLCLSAAVGM